MLAPLLLHVRLDTRPTCAVSHMIEASGLREGWGWGEGCEHLARNELFCGNFEGVSFLFHGHHHRRVVADLERS